jgi:AraC family transcriptional regulator
MGTSDQEERINRVLYAIHQDISAPLRARDLARLAAWSEQHFHRVFARVVGEPVHAYIRRTRLEQAANQLMFTPDRAIEDIAADCGFRSLSSFSRAFREYFAISPGRWRKADRPIVRPWLSDPEIAAGYRRIRQYPLPPARLIEREPQPLAYVRHSGYGRSISNAWLYLKAWTNAGDRPFAPQIGLHHSNPAWVPLAKCRYVACIGIDSPVLRRAGVSTMTLPGGLHARFRLQGIYGELLPWLTRILEEWLPGSGLKMATTPAFVEYRRNHFLEPDEKFDVDLFLPVSFY